MKRMESAENTQKQKKLGLAGNLSSPDKKMREKAASLLLLWLTSQDKVKDDDLRTIWKGLFYCVWRAEKLSAQADLAEKLASIIEKLDLDLSLQFLKEFLSTMRREWGKIDELHVDKFYLLLRQYLTHTFRLLGKHGWDTVWTEKFMNAYLEESFLVEDDFVSQGMKLCMVDNFLPEVTKCLPLTPEAFKLVVEPFCVILAKSPDDTLVERVKERVFGYLISVCEVFVEGKQQEGEGGDKLLAHLLFSIPLSSLFSGLFASMDCKALRNLHEAFSMLEKRHALSGETSLLVRMEEDTCQYSDMPQLQEAVEACNPPEGVPETKSLEVDKDPVEDNSGNEKLTPRITMSESCMGLGPDDPVVSNLKKRFDSISSDGLTDWDNLTSPSCPFIPSPTGSSRKRKRGKYSAYIISFGDTSPCSTGENNEVSPDAAVSMLHCSADSTEMNSTTKKKVQFSLKDNIEWRPHNPLPPHDVRVPPSATPRGSALKKGVPPGPIVVLKEFSPNQKKGAGSTPRNRSKAGKKKCRIPQ